MSTYSGGSVIVWGSSPKPEKFLWYEDNPAVLFSSASTAVPIPGDGRRMQAGTPEEYVEWCNSRGIVIYPDISPGGAS